MLLAFSTAGYSLLLLLLDPHCWLPLQSAINSEPNRTARGQRWLSEVLRQILRQILAKPH